MRAKRTQLVALAALVVAVLLTLPASALPASGQALRTSTADAAAPRWHQRLDELVAGKSVGVAVMIDGQFLYRRHVRKARVPASNQKLLSSMALLDAVPATTRITTTAAARSVEGSTVRGNLWLLGTGDPTVTSGGRYARALPFRPSRLKRLAQHIHDAGVRRITGSVKGGISHFRHDWWARGWQSDFPARYIALPSALSFNANTVRDRHISDPERRAARSLTRKLRDLGVRVADPPGAGTPPSGAAPVATMNSVPLERLLRFQNRRSSNYFAETLGKYLAVASGRQPGTMAGGAAAVEQWAQAQGVVVTSHDASGLSYANRVSARGVTRLLDGAADEAWGSTFRSTLPAGGQGTLKDRLGQVRVRAKTGTLRNISALSGYVYLQRRDAWASFSILSSGTSKQSAVRMENRIVRLLEERAG